MRVLRLFIFYFYRDNIHINHKYLIFYGALFLFPFHIHCVCAQEEVFLRSKKTVSRFFQAVRRNLSAVAAAFTTDALCRRTLQRRQTLDRHAGKDNMQSPAYISKAVSRCTGKNFKTFINKYRAKETIRLLSEKDARNRSIDDIAFESDFNDRKTFHRIFKKTTGLTPSEFRKSAVQGKFQAAIKAPRGKSLHLQNIHYKQ
jgi:AraC-like DNA-binding protein